MNWLQTNWLSLTIVIAICIIFILWIIYLCKKNGLKQIALDAILKAEKDYNTKSGQERLEYAVYFVYDRLPDIVKLFLTKDLALTLCKNIVQQTFDEVKALLDYQKPTLNQGKE